MVRRITCHMAVVCRAARDEKACACRPMRADDPETNFYGHDFQHGGFPVVYGWRRGGKHVAAYSATQRPGPLQHVQTDRGRMSPPKSTSGRPKKRLPTRAQGSPERSEHKSGDSQLAASVPACQMLVASPEWPGVVRAVIGKEAMWLVNDRVYQIPGRSCARTGRNTL